MRRIALIIVIFAIAGVASVYAQRCGGSTRRLKISGAEGPISYELSYVAPKNGNSASLDDRVIGKFLNEFLADFSLSGNFWQRDILEVRQETANQYLKLYRETDFAYISGDVWRKHHKAQLRGESADGVISFRTAEMDNTPFLLTLTGKGIETKYLLSAFLGGCYERDEVQTIVVSKEKK